MRSEPVGCGGLELARTQCANGEKKIQNLRRGRARQTKKGGAFNAPGGWLVSTLSAWASKPFWGKKKPFGPALLLIRAAALPGWTRRGPLP